MEAEAVNRPHGGRRMAPLHQRLQRAQLLKCQSLRCSLAADDKMQMLPPLEAAHAAED